jgi:hypothetical protein
MPYRGDAPKAIGPCCSRASHSWATGSTALAQPIGMWVLSRVKQPCRGEHPTHLILCHAASREYGALALADRQNIGPFLQQAESIRPNCGWQGNFAGTASAKTSLQSQCLQGRFWATSFHLSYQHCMSAEPRKEELQAFPCTTA